MDLEADPVKRMAFPVNKVARELLRLDTAVRFPDPAPVFAPRGTLAAVDAARSAPSSAAAARPGDGAAASGEGGAAAPAALGAASASSPLPASASTVAQPRSAHRRAASAQQPPSGREALSTKPSVAEAASAAFLIATQAAAVARSSAPSERVRSISGVLSASPGLQSPKSRHARVSGGSARPTMLGHAARAHAQPLGATSEPPAAAALAAVAEAAASEEPARIERQDDGGDEGAAPMAGSRTRTRVQRASHPAVAASALASPGREEQESLPDAALETQAVGGRSLRPRSKRPASPPRPASPAPPTHLAPEPAHAPRAAEASPPTADSTSRRAKRSDAKPTPAYSGAASPASPKSDAATKEAKVDAEPVAAAGRDRRKRARPALAAKATSSKRSRRR